MSGSVNKVILLGRLGADPEIVSTNDGNKIAKFSLATSERWRDRNTGEQREKTEWHRVVIFNENLSKLAEQYLRKGSQVYIEGQIQTRKWQDQNGQDKYTTEVVLGRFNGVMTFIGGRNDSGSMASDSGYGGDSSSGRAPMEQKQPSPPPMNQDLDDDIPF